MVSTKRFARSSLDLGCSAPRSLLGTTLVAVAFVWAVAAFLLVYPGGYFAEDLAATGARWAVAVFAGLAFTWAIVRTPDTSRFFWKLLAGGLLYKFVADMEWTGFRLFGYGPVGLTLKDLTYVVSYLLLFGALVHLAGMTAGRITFVSALEAASIMLSVGMLVWYFVLGPTAATLMAGSAQELLRAFTQPACNAALLYLALIVLCADPGSLFARLLTGAFLSFLIADGVYLRLSISNLYEVGHWPELIGALGIILLGLSILAPIPSRVSSRLPSDPRGALPFWFSPLSPALHYGLLLFWGATHPPLPGYAVFGGVLLMALFVLRAPFVAFTDRRHVLRREFEVKRDEQTRLSEELHDALKPNVRSVSLLLGAYEEVRRTEEPKVAEEILTRAVEASQEASYRISCPISELQALCSIPGADPAAPLRKLLEDVQKHSRVVAREDLRVDIGGLNPEELAAAYKVAGEALWNASRHSGAKNVWLVSDNSGSDLVIEVRDDGCGLSAADSTEGVGFPLMRKRASEAGAGLEIDTKEDRGTIVRLRFAGR